MSLHVLANHMATKGRGPDSMLVHMSPQEVASLQALAMKNGGSLTINPDTGLPEAGWLSKLLPAIAGFALNAFAPGIGSAIGGALGLGAAAGTGIAVGGITGLATGSLSKGLMAGLGAYGGAGLADSFMGAGASSLVNAGAPIGAENVAGAAVPPIEQVNPSNFGLSSADKLGAGFKAVTESPSAFGQFAKDNWKAGLAAASPVIADAMVPTTVKMPNAQATGYIRPYQYDANTHTVKAMDPVLASEWGTRQFPDFIRKAQAQPQQQMQPQPPGGMARGGIVALAEGGEADPYARFNTMSGQSKAAYDYLMGRTANVAPSGVAIPTRPVVSNTNAPVIPATGGGDGGAGGVGSGVGEIGGGIVTLPSVNPVEPPPVEPPPVEPPADFWEPNVVEPSPSIRTQPIISDIPEELLPTEIQPITPTTPLEMPELPAVEEPVAREPVDKSFWDEYPDPSIYTEPITSDIPLEVPVEEIPRIVPTTPLELPELPAIEEPVVSDPVWNDIPVEPSIYTQHIGSDIPLDMPVEEVEPFTPSAPIELPELPPMRELEDRSFWDDSPDPSIYTAPIVSDIPDEIRAEDIAAIMPEGSYSTDGYPGGIPGYEGYTQYGSSGKGDFMDAYNDYGDLSGGYGSYYGAANGGMVPGYAMGGGLGSLGGYSDGGRLLKGPGDGVSDSIPATIGNKKQPARLADGEFVVPARIVSELGNGSTEAGARKLYAMMDRIQKARGKTVGKGKVAANSRADKHLPA